MTGLRKNALNVVPYSYCLRNRHLNLLLGQRSLAKCLTLQY